MEEDQHITKCTLYAAAAVLCIMSTAALAQPVEGKASEAGLPFVKWFSPAEYGGATQVWSFAQDDRGILYAGHTRGLLEYDGTSWRAIATPHGGIVRCLARGPGGRIFVGEVGDFGYLQPDKTGEMQFTSLLEFVPREARDFSDVFKIHATPEGIYFQAVAAKRLFRLTPEGQGWRTKVWKPAGRIRNSFYVFGTLYLAVSGVGLQKLNGDALETVPLPGLEQSKSPNTNVTAMLPYSEADSRARQILVATLGGQLYLRDDDGLRPFPVEAGLAWKLGISSGAVLGDGAFGFYESTGGFLILERNGKLRRYLDREAGIQSDGVLAVFVDRGGTVWLGLQRGISKVEGASPFSEFGTATGMSAAVNDIIRYRGVLNVGTMAGVRYLDTKSSKFRVIPGTETAGVFGLLVHGDSLLAAAGNVGVLEVTGSVAKPVILAKAGASYYVMASSRQDPNRVWLGMSGSLASMRLERSGRWVDEGEVAKTPEVRSIVEPEPGLLWLGTAQGVVRIRFQADSPQKPEVRRFRKADGLPGDGGVSVHFAAGRVVFASLEGVREFDSTTERFIPSKLFGAIPTGGSAEEYTVAPDRRGNLWVNFGRKPVLLQRQNDGGYTADETRLRRIADGEVSWLFADDDGVVWMGGPDRVIRYDPAMAGKGNVEFPALVRRVSAGERAKTVLYGGGGGAAAAQGLSPLPYRDNTLRFEYTAASFEDPLANQFQTQLEGFDRGWSEWNKETRRDYTNLPPGKFRFRVKARNLLLQEGKEAEYRLAILPPWYRTWWAYGLYVLALAAGVFVVDRLMRRRLIAREREKSMLREAELRAETAAAEAKTLQAENERNKNVELLSEIGKDLTSSLDLDAIFFKLYEHVNQLMDATVFGVGLYHPELQEIEYRLAVEKGKRFAPYTRDTRNRNQFPVWCIENRKPVFLNDVASEYSQYIEVYEELPGSLADGTISTAPASLVYLPLIVKDRVLGVITVQSFSKNAYTAYHLDLLENLAAYTSIALDNADAYLRLKSAQDQLLVQQRLASLGALTAGIAHEIKNPLNFVNNFADLSVELAEELRAELEKLKTGVSPDYENIDALLGDLSSNAKKINEHGKRADGIVRSMLLHSRGEAGERQSTDINSILEEYVNLSYHGMRAQDSSFNVTIERDYGSDVGRVDAIPQDLSRVFLNLLNNACYAAGDRAKKAGAGYVPTLRVRTVNLGDSIEVRVRDNGMGIPPEVREKIFNPFFTTKPTGQGTGLGLSISYDIVVQEHGGQLEVDTVPGEYTEFVVRLPRQWIKAA